MGYSYYQYASGATRTDYIEYGGGYYYHSYTYDNAYTGYYHHNVYTMSLYGDTVYRDDVSTKDSAAYQETLYQNQFITGTHDPRQTNGSNYNVYTSTATTHTYVNLYNYGEGWTETNNIYGTGGHYGEYISGYMTYDGPIKGFEGNSYSSYVYAYNGITYLR